MATAEQDARERADRLRRVLDECEAVLADGNAEPERRATAEKWLGRLGGIGSLADNAGSMGRYAIPAGSQRHTRGGGQADHQGATYDGWGDE